MAQILAITGMHRSGTSMVSSLLQAGGVHIGDKLLPANEANPRGYFEDRDFCEFQDRLLRERQQHYLYVDNDFRFEPSTLDKERARQLAAARSQFPVWAWKDPRTSLLLDFWHEQLPDARFLFLIRHPMEVLLSLLRRGEFDHRPDLAAGLQAWRTYNANVQSFYSQYPDRCLLVHIDGLTAQVEQFARLVQQKLEIEVRIDSDTLKQVYDARELRRTQLPQEVADILNRTNPGLIELYDELNAQADLPSAANQRGPKASSRLSSLKSFAAALPEPISLSDQYNLLGLLSSSLAPELTDAMVRRFCQNNKQLMSSGKSERQVARNGIRPLPGFNHVHTSPAQMRMPERVALYSLIFGIQPRNCLEIGTARGGSSAIICGAMDDVGFGQLACVDPMPEVDSALWSQISHRCRMFQGPSPAILSTVAEQVGTKFDFVLIDGDHNYDGVRADIAGALPLMADQAYVLFHDAHCPDVKRAIDEAVVAAPELTDCGLISVEPTVIKENGYWMTWAGFRLLRYQRAGASASSDAPATVSVAIAEPLSGQESSTTTAAAANLVSSPPINRVPVVLAGIKCLSGVTTWAERLRSEMAGHPRYDLRLLHIGPERPPGYDLYAANPEEARGMLGSMAPAVLVPNYVWDLYLAGCDADITCLGMCHSHSVEEYFLPLTWYESRIAQFIAVSPECAAKLTERIPFRARDITTLPYGVPVPRELNRDYKTDPVRIIYAGRLAQAQKRVGDFVRLVEHLLQAQVPFQFDIVGDGEEFEPLEHAMQHWFPKAQVHFHGRLPHEEVDRMWPAFDVFVQTSEFEGTSVSMLEAMAQGVVPVVTAATSGVEGVIVHEKNGFVVPVGDMPAMAATIARLAANSSLLAATGWAAHQSAQAYAMDAYCKQFTRVLDRVIRAGRSADQAKCAGGFGGHHPLYAQHQVIRNQQAELDQLRPVQSKPTWFQKQLRSIRKRLPGWRAPQTSDPKPADRKAA